MESEVGCGAAEIPQSNDKDISTETPQAIPSEPVAFCFSDLHKYACGFIIKGMSRAKAGMLLEGLSFFRTARLVLDEGSVTTEDVELFTARCANFSSADFPEEFHQIPREDEAVGAPIENALLKFFAGALEADLLLQLGKYSDTATVTTYVKSIATLFEDPELAGVTEELKTRVSYRASAINAEIVLRNAKYAEALQLADANITIYGLIGYLRARGKLLCFKGRCQSHQGHFDDAIVSFKEAETAQKNIILVLKGKGTFEEGEDTDEVIASIRQGMAEAYLSSYRLPMAMGLLRQTLASRKPLLGIHHISTVETSVSLGQLLYRQYNIVKAIAAFDSVIELLATPEMVAAIGSDSLLLASCHLLKADCLRAAARFDDAKNLYSSALRIRKLFYGDVKHPACAEVTEENAVNMCLRARTYASAEPVINQCVEVCKVALGEKHPQYARSLFHKGCILRDTNAFSDATLVLEQSLALTAAVFGDASWPVTEVREALLYVKIAQGSLKSAKSDVNSILNSRKLYFSQVPEHKAEPEAHPEVACLFLHLAEIERLSGDGTYEEISALVDKTVVAYSKAGYLGKNHPRTLSAKAEKCFLRHQMAPTVAYRHSGYLKMRMILETLMEKGFCDDHPWVIRYKIDEGEYPPGLDPGNPYEEEDEEAETAPGDIEMTMSSEEDYSAAPGASAVVGTGSGEIDGCDDGGAEPQSGDSPDLSVSKYLYLQGKKLLFEGDLKSARTLFEQCHSHRQRIFGNNEVAVFALLYIAEVDFRMGRYQESDHTFHQCIDEFTAVCGAKSLQVAEALHRIGLNFHVLGNYKAAMNNLDRAMLLRKQVLPPSSKDLATSLHCIGLLKLDLHALDDASALFTKSFQIRKQKFGDNHLDVAESFVAKALLLERQARYNDALNCVVSASSIRENIIFDQMQSPLAADCFMMRSRVSLQKAEYEISLGHCSSAHEIYLTLLGPDHPRTWAALHLKAEILYTLGNIIESKKLFEDVLQKRIDLFGENHISVADTLYGIAQNLRELAHYAAAEEHYRSAINLMKMEYIDRHPKILSCQFGIAECYRAIGDKDKSKALHDKVKRNRQDMLGKQHPDFLACLQVSVDFKIRVDGEQVEAENLLKVLLQSKKKILGDEHPDTSDALNSLGEFLRLNHRYGEANVAFDEALYIKLKTVGEKHPRTIEIINNMALRNATFRVRNLALEKQKTLLAQSQSFMKEEMERQKSQSIDGGGSHDDDNPFRSFEEPICVEPIDAPLPDNVVNDVTTEVGKSLSDVSDMKLSLKIRKIDAGGLQKSDIGANSDPYVALSIEKPFAWFGKTSTLQKQGADAIWEFSDGDENQMVIRGTVGQIQRAIIELSVLDENNTLNDKPIGYCDMDLSGAIPDDKTAADGETSISVKIVNKKGNQTGTVTITFGTRFDDLPSPLDVIAAARQDGEEDTLSQTMSMSRIPVFDSSDFKKSVDDLNNCIRLLEKVFLASEKYGSESSHVHPMIANIKGNIGIVDKLEAEAKEQFVERLSKEEKRLFMAVEEAIRMRELENNEDEVVFEPGQKAIHEAVMYFDHFPLLESHYWREKFKALAEKGVDSGDDTVRQAEVLLKNAVKNMQRSLISNAYSEYEESNKVLTTDPRKAAQGHMLVAIAQQGMAKCLSYMCKFEEAKVLYASSVAMQRKLCPDDDEMVAGILFDLAEAERQCGAYGDAINTMMESLEVRKHLRIKADENNQQPSVVELQSMLAVSNLHLEAGQFLKGIQLCNEVVEISKNYSFPIPLELANAYVVQAKIYIQLARYTQAYSAVDKAHNLRRKEYWKKDHLDIAECFQIKAQLLLLHKADNMNALRLSTMALLMRKRCIIASLTILDDYEIAAKLAADYEEKAAAEEAEGKVPDAEGNVTASAEIVMTEDNTDGSVASVESKSLFPADEASVASGAKSLEGVHSDPTAAGPYKPVDDPNQPLPEHSLTIESLLWKGRCQHEMGKYSAALELFEEALQMNAVVFSEDHFMSGIIKFHMAEALHANASYKDARENYIAARSAMLKQYGEKSIPVLEVNCALASNDRAVSKFLDAFDLLEYIHSLAVELVTTSHPLVGRICYALAETSLDLGDFEKSRMYFERSLSIRQGAFLDSNPSHPFVALNYFGLGECLRVAGLYTEAGVQYDKAHTMIVSKYGDSHPLTAKISHGLSTHRRVVGQYISAKGSYEAAMVARRDSFGKNHVITAESLLGIGYNSFDQGMFKVAHPYFQKALQVISARILSEIYDGSPYHSLLADAIYGCAENARALAEYHKAEELYRQVLEHRYAIYGENHFLTQMANCGLAEVYRATERWEDASRLNKTVLNKLAVCLNEEDKRVAKVMMHAAHVLECQGQYPLSKGLHERAYQMLGRLLGSNHAETARSLTALARMSRILGKLDVSKAQHDVAMRSKKIAFSGQQADIALSYSGMGETYLAMGLFDKSYILFLKAICIQKPQLGENHPDLFSSLMGLAETLRALGRVSNFKTVIKEHEEMYGGEYIDPFDSVDEAEVDDCNNPDGDADKKEKTDSDGKQAATSKSNKLEAVGPEVPPEVRELEEQCGYQLDAYAMCMHALHGASKCFGPVNLPVASASLGVTKCLCDMGRFREASVLCRDVLKMQRRLVGDEHNLIIASLAQQANILLRWGRLYPVEEVPVFNPDIADSSVNSLCQESTSDMSLGWAVASTRALTQAKGGFTWKHGYCNKEKLGVPGGFMGYQYPTRPVIKRASAFDDNLLVKEHPINTIEEFQRSHDINDPYSISVEDDKFLEYTSEPLTGDVEKLIEVGLAMACKKYPPTGEHPGTAVLLLLKGSVLSARGLRVPAKKAFSQALSMQQRLLTPGHPAIAEVLHAIGKNCLALGDISNAYMNVNKSLLFRQTIFGRNHVCIADNLVVMASIRLGEGSVDEAKDLAMEALALRVKWLHKGHYLVANASQLLGSIFLATGSSLEAARIMFKNAIDIKIKTFGEYHYEVCLCCNDYALVLLKMKRYEEALDIFSDAYKVQRRLFGDIHPDLATTIHNQASVLLEMNDYEGAEKLFLQSLAMKRELFGFEHPLVATALHNIAGLYQLMQKLDSAYKLYIEALSIRTKVFGEIHETVAETLNNLGLLSFSQSRFNDSIDEFEKSLAIKRRIFNSRHPRLASTLCNIACVYYSLQDFELAEKHYVECLSIREAALGAEHPDTVSCREILEGLEKTRSEVLPGRIIMSQTSNTSVIGLGNRQGHKVEQQNGNILLHASSHQDDRFNRTI